MYTHIMRSNAPVTKVWSRCTWDFLRLWFFRLLWPFPLDWQKLAAAIPKFNKITEPRNNADLCWFHSLPNSSPGTLTALQRFFKLSPMKWHSVLRSINFVLSFGIPQQLYRKWVSLQPWERNVKFSYFMDIKWSLMTWQSRNPVISQTCRALDCNPVTSWQRC